MQNLTSASTSYISGNIFPLFIRYEKQKEGNTEKDDKRVSDSRQVVPVSQNVVPNKHVLVLTTSLNRFLSGDSDEPFSETCKVY